MAIIQAARPGSSGGGGGLTITGFEAETFQQTTNFISGGVVLTLANTPLTDSAIEVDYNGQRLLYGSSWSYAAGQVTILFADPYVTDYDTPPFFQVTYPY